LNSVIPPATKKSPPREKSPPPPPTSKRRKTADLTVNFLTNIAERVFKDRIEKMFNRSS